MLIYKAPIRDMRFIVEAFGYTKRIASLEPFEDYDLDTFSAMLEATSAALVDTWLPLNPVGDKEGLTYDPETYSVTLPDGFKEAYKATRDAGFVGITGPLEYGGSGAPEVLGVLLGEMATSTNKSLSMAPGLSNGLISSLVSYGTDEQKAKYLPKLVTGEWTGTMCLTEPQCGTDLGLIRTKAVPVDGEEGAYTLSGTKIWITFGEHNLTDNILHLVLGRLPDAPDGIKGISAFVVPKFLDDGTRNPVFCTGLEHKMGIHASPTCVMSLEEAKGYLVGTPHKGMRSMFKMMNMARLHVGLEGLSLSEIAYQTALAFAKERRQSRSLNPTRNDPDASADNILVHPDVRRMLLNVKSTNEGMRGIITWIAMENDIAHHHEDAQAREDAADVVALMTPVIKSYFTERGFLNISEAMQVTGGAGYTTDWYIEQYMRDERIAMIYEGTNHIQALDLVGRKLPMKGGRLMRKLGERIGAFIAKNKEVEGMAEFVAPLEDAFQKLSGLTMDLAMKGMQDPEHAAAIASNYLNVFGLTALSYSWCIQVKHALSQNDAFAQTKLKTARYFMHMVLPEINGYIAIISAGKDPMMDFDVDEL